MVTIAGDAGVGKSRLLYEFEAWLDLLPQRLCFFQGAGQPGDAVAALRPAARPVRFPASRSRIAIRPTWSAPRSSRASSGVLARSLHSVDLSREPRCAPTCSASCWALTSATAHTCRRLLDDAQQLRDRALIYLGEFVEAAAGQRAGRHLFWRTSTGPTTARWTRSTTWPWRCPGVRCSSSAWPRPSCSSAGPTGARARPSTTGSSCAPVQARWPPPGGRDPAKGGERAGRAARRVDRRRRGQSVLRRRADQDAHRGRRRRPRGGRAVAGASPSA